MATAPALYRKLSFDPLKDMTPAGLRTHLESEIAKWAPVIKKAGIYAD